MRNFVSMGLAVALMSAGLLWADDKDKPKYTTKEVMKLAHKEKLLNKVMEGKASDDEKKKLVELYEAMAANKPPKGDADNWKKLNDALVDAAKKADADALKKASNCGACHSAHK